MPTFQHEHWMKIALELAQKGRLTAPPNPWVGCVIVKNDQLIGQGYHEKPGLPHAEINALKSCTESPEGATVYVTLEPCCHVGKTPPCTDALIKAKVKKVIIGVEDLDTKVQGGGIQALKNAGIEVKTGVLKEEIEADLRSYLYHRSHFRPFTILKAAISLDGKIATASSESFWLSGEKARLDAHLLRANSQAILVGKGTALADKPALTVRHPDVPATCKPLRVILDPRGEVPPEGKLFDPESGPTLIITVDTVDAEVLQMWKKAGVEIEILPRSSDNTGVSLLAVLDLLAKRGVLQLLVEGGSKIFTSFIKQKLFQQLILYKCPLLIGETAIPFYQAPSATSLKDVERFNLKDVQVLDHDVRLTYE